MTRHELISELMRQVREATDDTDLCRLIEFRLRTMPGAQLRDIYSRNSAAVALTPRSRLLLLGSFSSSPAVAEFSHNLPAAGHPAHGESACSHDNGTLRRGNDFRRRA